MGTPSPLTAVTAAFAATVVTGILSRRQTVPLAGLRGVDRATAEATATVVAARAVKVKRRTILLVTEYFALSKLSVRQGSVT